MYDLIRIDDEVARLEQVSSGERKKRAESIVSELVSLDPSTPRDLYLATILRIAAIDYGLIYDDTNNRQLVLKIVAEQIQVSAPAVSSRLELTSRIQADEVCRRISGILPETVSNMQDAIQSYAGVQTLSVLRNRIPRFLNSPSAKISVGPFFRISVSELTHCIGAAISYVECDDPRRVREAYDDAQRALRRVLEKHDGKFTRYEDQILGVLEKVKNDVSLHFTNGPHGKPAKLEIRDRPRRYPLHLEESNIVIPIELRNSGEGVAFNIEVDLVESIGVVACGEPIHVSSMEPGSMVIEARVRTVQRPERKDHALCVFRVAWINADGRVSENGGFEVLLEPQDPDINWEEMQQRDPYSLAAVMHREQLIGRGRIINRIVGTLSTNEVGSLYIHGEKRVGKTSVAHVALEEMGQRGIQCVFRDIGTIVHPDPERAINNLTERLTEDVARKVPLLADQAKNIRLDGSLTFLNRLLEAAADYGTRMVIALDEFDQLPSQLFGRNSSADAFFSGLRSISAIRGIGLVLIAGERMKLIINGAGVYLNRFVPFPVDYIERESQWTDFEILVRQPTEGKLDFSTEAISRIYEFTAGNPYYTKQICGVILGKRGRSPRCICGSARSR